MAPKKARAFNGVLQLPAHTHRWRQKRLGLSMAFFNYLPTHTGGAKKGSGFQWRSSITCPHTQVAPKKARAFNGVLQLPAHTHRWRQKRLGLSMAFFNYLPTHTGGAKKGSGFQWRSSITCPHTQVAPKKARAFNGVLQLPAHTHRWRQKRLGLSMAFFNYLPTHTGGAKKGSGFQWRSSITCPHTQVAPKKARAFNGVLQLPAHTHRWRQKRLGLSMAFFNYLPTHTGGAKKGSGFQWRSSITCPHTQVAPKKARAFNGVLQLPAHTHRWRQKRLGLSMAFFNYLPTHTGGAKKGSGFQWRSSITCPHTQVAPKKARAFNGVLQLPAHTHRWRQKRLGLSMAFFNYLPTHTGGAKKGSGFQWRSSITCPHTQVAPKKARAFNGVLQLPAHTHRWRQKRLGLSMVFFNYLPTHTGGAKKGSGFQWRSSITCPQTQVAPKKARAFNGVLQLPAHTHRWRQKRLGLSMAFFNYLPTHTGGAKKGSGFQWRSSITCPHTQVAPKKARAFNGVLQLPAHTHRWRQKRLGLSMAFFNYLPTHTGGAKKGSGFQWRSSITCPHTQVAPKKARAFNGVLQLPAHTHRWRQKRLGLSMVFFNYLPTHTGGAKKGSGFQMAFFNYLPTDTGGAKKGSGFQWRSSITCPHTQVAPKKARAFNGVGCLCEILLFIFNFYLDLMVKTY